MKVKPSTIRIQQKTAPSCDRRWRAVATFVSVKFGAQYMLFLVLPWSVRVKILLLFLDWPSIFWPMAEITNNYKLRTVLATVLYSSSILFRLICLVI
jgi:hypothetical protein